MVDKTSGSKSSTVGITDVCNQRIKRIKCMSHRTDIRVHNFLSTYLVFSGHFFLYVDVCDLVH